MCNQLIIIGNGFDKACGLKSGYGDWYKSRLGGNSNLRKLIDMLIETPTIRRNRRTFQNEETSDFARLYQGDYLTLSSKLKMTAWDIILVQKRKASGSWKDVEELIEQVLKRDSGAPHEIFDLEHLQRECLYEYINSENSVPIDMSSVAEINPVVILLADRYTDIFRNKILDCTKYKDSEGFRPDHSEEDVQQIYELLLKELNLFEQEFAGYLTNQVNDEAYVNGARELLSELSSGKSEDAVIMSFNYTMPFTDSCSTYNVHGTIRDDNIIFGIDRQDNDDRNCLRFTKTFRKLFNAPTGVLSDCKDVDVIKFYGHSLGRMDYSYFLSIFDSLCVYSNKIRIKFLYSNHSGNPLETQNKQFEAVVNLFERYGKNLGNQQQGKNFMHKLMLEGRLSIDQINVEAILKLVGRSAPSLSDKK